jgi:hypothetical protein
MVLKNTTKAFLMVFVIFTATMFYGCGNKTAPQVVSIKTAETLNIDDTGIDLPEIRLQYNDGTEKAAAMGELWFIATNTFVQNDKVYVKQNAPFIFKDEMSIIYRNDKSVKTTLKIIKQYIPLDGIMLSTADNVTTCKQGETLQINAAFIPVNASDKNIEYQIIVGAEFAQIDGTGLLTVAETAPVGAEITVRAAAVHGGIAPDIVDDIDESNIVTITVTKSYEVITVLPSTERVYVPEKDGFAFYGYYTGKNGTNTQYFDYKGNAVNEITAEMKLYAYWIITKITIPAIENNTGHIESYAISSRIALMSYLELDKLQEIGYVNVNFYMYWSWCESDGKPDCDARVILRSFYLGDTIVNDDNAYIHVDRNPETKWHEINTEVDIDLPTVISRPDIQAVFVYIKHESKSWYEVDWAYITVTVS